MPYRPQFAFEIPDGYADEEFTYYFDSTNTPGLNLSLSPGQQRLNIVLQLEGDAEYLWRGVQVVEATGKAGVRFRTPHGDFLSDPETFVPVNLSYGFQVLDNPGQCPTPLENEIVCPPGSVILLDVKNLS